MVEAGSDEHIESVRFVESLDRREADRARGDLDSTIVESLGLTGECESELSRPDLPKAIAHRLPLDLRRQSQCGREVSVSPRSEDERKETRAPLLLLRGSQLAVVTLLVKEPRKALERRLVDSDLREDGTKILVTDLRDSLSRRVLVGVKPDQPRFEILMARKSATASFCGSSTRLSIFDPGKNFRDSARSRRPFKMLPIASPMSASIGSSTAARRAG